MTYTFVLRLLDTFFRNWTRYLVPIVLLGAVGLATADRTEQFASRGVVFVEEESFLSSLTQVRADEFSFLGPGEVAQLELRGLLGTDTFATAVLSRASGGDIIPTAYQLYELRTSISSSVSSDIFLGITVVHADPESARVLATAVIDEFVNWHIAADIEGSQTAEQFYDEVVVTSQTSLDAATATLADFLLRNPDPVEGTRSSSEALQLAQLQNRVTVAQAEHDAATANLESARLATAQAATDVASTYRIVDRPQAPVSAEPWLMDLVARTLFFAALGFAVSAIVLVVTTVTDTSVRFPTEVRARLGVNVLAVVPSIRK